jgi:hypothetical protein
LPLKNLPNDAELAYLALQRADAFAFGPVGFAAFTAEGDLAVRILVRHPKAIAIFQLIADRAGPGGLYALAALRALDRDAYEKSLPQFKASLARERRKKVTLQAGCIAHDELISEVLTKLEAGAYDSFIPKPK